MKLVIDGQCFQTTSLNKEIGNFALGLISALKRIENISIKILLNGSDEDTRLQKTLEQLLRFLSVEDIAYFYSPKEMNFLDYGTNTYEDSEKLYEIAVMAEKPDWLVIPSMFESVSMEDSVVPPLNRLCKYVKTAVICTGFIPFENKELYLKSTEQKIAYKICLEEMGSSHLLVCNSQITAEKSQRILRWPKKIVVYGAGELQRIRQFCISVSLGNDRRYTQNLSNRNFILHYGETDTRDTLQTLINAYSKLPKNIQESYELLILYGKPIRIEEEFKRLTRGMNVQVLGYLSEIELQQCINRAKVFVFLENEEEFGLKLLEIYEQGGVCICANSGVLDEIYGFREGQFDPSDVAGLSSILKRIITDEELYRKARSYCRSRSPSFSWDLSAKKMIEGLKSVSNNVEGYNFSLKDLGLFRRDDSERLLLSISLRKQFKTTVFFDVTNYIRSKYCTGIQRVVGKMVENYGDHYGQCDVIYVVGCLDGVFRQVKLVNGEWLHHGVVTPTSGDFYVCVDLVQAMLPSVAQTVLQWKNRGVRLVYCIHDIGFVFYPENIALESSVKQLRNYLSFISQNASIIVSPSRSVRNEVMQWCKENKIKNERLNYTWFHLGSDFLNKSQRDLGVESKRDGVFRFLMVSTIEPRKDYGLLLEAFKYVCSQGLSFELHIVGREGWNSESIIEKLRDKSFCNNRLFWHSDCSDDELNSLYKQCNCFVFTSMYEGFGIPVVEAINHGLPLILRDINVFREIAGDKALYFNNSRGLGRLMVGVIKNPDMLIDSDQIRTLTWEESAKMLWDATITDGKHAKNIFSDQI